MKLICQSCGIKYEKGKFCLECGSPLTEVAVKKVLFCPECQTEITKGKFCPECGTKLVEREVEVPDTDISVTDKKEETATPAVTSIPRLEESVVDSETEAILAKYQDEYGDMRNLNQEEYAIAAEEIKQCADKGNVQAICFLASLYMDGHGVAQDHSKAYELLCDAENKGSKYATAILGLFYAQGIIVEADEKEAIRRLLEGYKATQIPGIAGLIAYYYISHEDYVKALEYARLSAEKNDKDGFKALGDLYLHGLGVKQDHQKAFEYYMQAAAQGEETALNQIGWMYQSGCGVEKDPEQAFFWYNEAAQKGSDVGLNNVGFCYQNGYGVEKDVEKAAEYFKKAAEMGYVDSMLELASYYDEIIFDLEKSKMWVEKAADLGSAEALNRLGVIYMDRENNPKEAVRLYGEAIELGFPMAYRNLAICYRDGKGVKKDLKKAEKLFAKASELGVEDADEIKAEMLSSNDDEQVDQANTLLNAGKQKEALAIYKELAEKGNKRAQGNYGNCLLHGWGVKQNLKEGIKWLEQSAKQESAWSYLRLAESYLGFDYNGKNIPVDLKKATEYLKKALKFGAAPEEVEHLGQMTIPSVDISNLKVNKDRTSNGNLGIEVVFKMVANGMVGRKLNITTCCVSGWEKGWIKPYGTPFVRPCHYAETCDSQYISTVWESFRFFIPYNQILNIQAEWEQTMVIMAWDCSCKKPELLACEELPYSISCITHTFRSNEWSFKLLRQDTKKRLVQVPKKKEWNVSSTTGEKPSKPLTSKLPMDKIRKAANASYPKKSLKELAIAALKIAEVIQERLPDADVSYMVHPSEFDSSVDADALPIHFLFRKNGVPAVAVVAVTENGYKTPLVLETAMCCEDNGVEYIRVYANGIYADWIENPNDKEKVEFCKNWLVEKISKHL